jgi:hypothetical protein
MDVPEDIQLPVAAAHVGAVREYLAVLDHGRHLECGLEGYEFGALGGGPRFGTS